MIVPKPLTERAKKQAKAAEQDDAKPVLIKKYPNRRLYNTLTSSYIVQDDIVELVKSDTPFVIEDTKTGEDITRSILNQVIFDQETGQSNFHFPLEFQKQLISMYGESYGQMVPDYLTEALKLFAAERTKMTEAMGSVVDRNTRAMMEFSQNLARQNMELFKQSWSMFGLMGNTSPDSKKSTVSDEVSKKSRPEGDDDELEEIQKQIDALQQRLKSLK